VGLRKEVADKMREAGFSSKELREFASAKTPDGSPQDIELIVQSETFEHMLSSRRDWFENALKSKKLGGLGLTYKEAIKLIDNFYVMRGRRKHKRDIWGWLKMSYRPKDKIQSKKKFQEAITFKSMVGKTLGKGYGDKLKIRYAPRNATQKCSHCKGSGTLRNLYGQNQTCIYCSGTGVQGQRFI